MVHDLIAVANLRGTALVFDLRTSAPAFVLYAPESANLSGMALLHGGEYGVLGVPTAAATVRRFLCMALATFSTHAN
jgi:hypothetical protein